MIAALERAIGIGYWSAISLTVHILWLKVSLIIGIILITFSLLLTGRAMLSIRKNKKQKEKSVRYPILECLN